jgi:hypothetical protein
MEKKNPIVDIAEVLPHLQVELAELVSRQRKLQRTIDMQSAESRLGRRQYLLMKKQNRGMIAYILALSDRVDDMEGRLAARAAVEETK